MACEMELTGVNEIVQERHEDKYKTPSKEHGTDDGDNPMDASEGCPREPKQTDGDEKRTHNGWGQSILRLHRRTSPLSSASVALVFESEADDRQNHTDNNTSEGKATNTLAPASPLLKYDGKRGKAHIHGAVDDGDIDGGNEDDRLLEQQQPRSSQGVLELMGSRTWWLVCVESGDVHFSCELGHVLGALAQDVRRVCLWDEDGAGNPGDASEGSHEPVEPTPALSLAKEASCNGT